MNINKETDVIFFICSAICEYLMGDEMLAYIGTNLGLNDIILTSVSVQL